MKKRRVANEADKADTDGDVMMHEARPSTGTVTKPNGGTEMTAEDSARGEESNRQEDEG